MTEGSKSIEMRPGGKKAVPRNFYSTPQSMFHDRRQLIMQASCDRGCGADREGCKASVEQRW
jgi:hypothetical protein